MKARIYVTLKASVLDPQGKAIHHAVESIGYRGIEDVRQGKFFEVRLDSAIAVGLPNSRRARCQASRSGMPLSMSSSAFSSM